MAVDANHFRNVTEITPEGAGWSYSGLQILTLAPGEQRIVATGGSEMLVLPLSGSATVECEGEKFELTGRHSVFTRISDFVYVPRDAEVTVSSADGGRFALPSARCEHRLPVRYRAAEETPVELRGAGQSSRQVNNLAAADTFECERMIVVEVLTPASNWSSYPPHKHDEDRPGEESVLEEIYYFEVQRERSEPVPRGEGRPAEDGQSRRGAAGDPIGYQRVYGTADRPEDLFAEVRTGDAVTIPHGWHGPSMAAPGYDLYYLNVMAGPGEERAWLICDDPVHAWVRGTWDGVAIDPRLPLTSVVEKPTEEEL